MKFDFSLAGDVKQCLTPSEIAKFIKAGKKEPNSHADKQWARDVLELWAIRCDLTFGQAIQLFKTSDFSYAKPIYARKLTKIPSVLPSQDEDGKPIWVDNPLWLRIKKMSEMEINDLRASLRGELSRCASLRHHSDKVSERKPSAVDTMNSKPRRKIHEDETRYAHMRRMRAALIVAMNPTQENLSELGRSFGL